jgi:hypothetical protein
LSDRAPSVADRTFALRAFYAINTHMATSTSGRPAGADALSASALPPAIDVAALWAVTL